jgi:transcription initiation factor IIF auxiliary subunit
MVKLKKMAAMGRAAERVVFAVNPTYEEEQARFQAIPFSIAE